MNYIQSLNGTSNLGALPKDISKLISKNSSSIKKTLKRADCKLLSFCIFDVSNTVNI